MLADSTYIVTFNNGGAGDNVYHLDAQGNVMSTATMPFEFIRDVAQGRDGNIYYCGSGPGWVMGKTNENFDTAFWIRGYGNGSSWGDWFSYLYVLPDSNILVTGEFPETLMKINYQTGDSLWNKFVAGYNRPFFPLKDSTLLIGDGYFLDK